MIGSPLEAGDRDQARAWLNRMKDAHSAADRQAFETWLAEDPAHKRAYDAVSASYAEAGILRMSKIGRERDLEAAFGRKRFGLGGALVAASAAALVILIGYELKSGFLGLRPVPLESVMLSSGPQARSVRLADGSGIELAPSSEVRIELGRTKRLALLRRGHIRVKIARDSRPFRIIAGQASIDAGAGTFDASLDGSRGTIVPNRASEVRHFAVRAAGDGPNVRAAPGAIQSRAGLEFSAEPLGEAVARINAAGAGPRIEIDPRLSELRVTGVFQQGSSEEIARSLGLAFGLEVTATPSGGLRLAR